jgi:ATPase subunit of ABC transporter with duplicated ATPase domains
MFYYRFFVIILLILCEVQVTLQQHVKRDGTGESNSKTKNGDEKSTDSMKNSVTVGRNRVDYKSIQIIKPNAQHNGLEISQEGFEKLASIMQKLAIVAVIGPYHSGKSFLLNGLLYTWRG